MSLDIYILTFCRNPSQLYGTLLVFPSLRMAFPNAEVHVIDNCSIPFARSAVRQATQQVGGHFTQLEQEHKHQQYLDYVLANHSEGPVVFLDPDIHFWKCVDGLSPLSRAN